jgi:hypothetical protein
VSERAEQMAHSVAAAARARGFGAEDLEAVTRALHVAMAPRLEQLDDDRHPAFLHPGRTALVLLRDVGDVDPAVVVVGVLHESSDALLRTPSKTISERVGPAAAAAVGSIPLPGDERLVERLVGLGPGVTLAALAERLDQLRHLHLREDLVDAWADSHAEVASAWLPLAARANPVLARRYAHWARTFAKRI